MCLYYTAADGEFDEDEDGYEVYFVNGKYDLREIRGHKVLNW
jgi:hypothetical protein